MIHWWNGKQMTKHSARSETTESTSSKNSKSESMSTPFEEKRDVEQGTSLISTLCMFQTESEGTYVRGVT